MARLGVLIYHAVQPQQTDMSISSSHNPANQLLKRMLPIRNTASKARHNADPYPQSQTNAPKETAAEMDSRLKQVWDEEMGPLAHAETAPRHARTQPKEPAEDPLQIRPDDSPEMIKTRTNMKAAKEKEAQLQEELKQVKMEKPDDFLAQSKVVDDIFTQRRVYNALEAYQPELAFKNAMAAP
jgi:hypothetical protein